MRGSIRERSPGHYALIIDLRDPATGNRKRKWHSFKGTKRAAQIECARLISELQGGGYLEPSKVTLAQFLDRWLSHIKSQVSPRSHERYAEIVHTHIVPLLGAVPLRKLRADQVSEFYTKALASGRRDGKGGLSPRTVHHIHRILKQALSQAVRWQTLARNPADVDPPRVERNRCRRSMLMKPSDWSRRRVAQTYSCRFYWGPCVGSGAARSRRCAGALLTWMLASLPLSPALNRRERECARRRLRVGRDALWYCRQCLSMSFASTGFGRRRDCCGSA
jgi:hypothetical protein